MKKTRSLILLVILGFIISSCSARRMFMVGTNGIATYNRHTGQFEVLWEYSERQMKIIHDTVFVDSCKMR